MLLAEKIEQTLFLTFLFFLPFQTRVILFQEPRFLEWTSGFVYLTDFLLTGCFLYWLMRRPHIVWSAADKALGVFLAVALISAFWGESVRMSVYQWVRMLELAFLFLYVEHNIKHYRRRDLISALLTSGLFQVSLAIGQFTLQHDLGLHHIEAGPLGAWMRRVANFFTPSGKYMRAYGTFSHPNVLGVFLLMGLGLAALLPLAFARSHKDLRFRIYDLRIGAVFWGANLLFLFAFFLTFSRAIIMVGVAGLVALGAWFWGAKESRRWGGVFLGMLILNATLVMALLWPEIRSRFVFARGDEAVEYRITSSESAVDIVKKNPIFGIGPGNYVHHIKQFPSDAPGKLPADGFQPVHNLYLLIASETGILGFAAYAIFLFFIIYGFWKAQPRYHAPFLIALTAVAALAAVDHYFWDIQQARLIWWFMWGILAAYGRSP